MKDVYYSEYLQLSKILGAQDLESAKYGKPAHDELLFIITHQAYELWFKQILFELDTIRMIFSQEIINDYSNSLYRVFHLQNRIITILRVLVHQIDILETMTSMDFLDFRNYLRPASGFQSVQFKEVEALLGLEGEHRHKREYFLTQLEPEDVERIKDLEEADSLLELVNNWLERLPFWDADEYWQEYRSINPEREKGIHPFWNDYLFLYRQSLTDRESDNLKVLRQLIFEDQPGDKFSAAARRSALFIILYRNYPLFQLPFQIMENLLEIDEQLATWRFRHLNMVNRMIGKRVGTGGSSGQGYLLEAMNKHYIFSPLAELSTFLIERQKLPKLPPVLQEALGFRRL